MWGPSIQVSCGCAVGRQIWFVSWPQSAAQCNPCLCIHVFQGVTALENGGLRAAAIDAVTQASRRSAELGVPGGQRTTLRVLHEVLGLCSFSPHVYFLPSWPPYFIHSQYLGCAIVVLPIPLWV